MYKSLVDNAQVGIVVHKRGRLRFVNREMAGLLRIFEPEESVGRDFADFIRPAFPPLKCVLLPQESCCATI